MTWSVGAPVRRARLRRSGLQVQEHSGAVVAGGLEQRGGDQVPDPARGEQVLGREQPVIAGQVHPAAQCHRLAQQPGAQAAGQLGRDWGGEEHPRVRADAGPGDLQGDGDLQGTAGLDVHEGVEHRLQAVEVSRQPPAPVAVQERIQADVGLALQVRGQHGRGRRPVMHNPRSGLEEGTLRRARRGSLLRAELQQLQQPGILRPQSRQLSLNRRRDLSHADTLSAHGQWPGGLLRMACMRAGWLRPSWSSGNSW